jgi:hypothetical protein
MKRYHGPTVRRGVVAGLVLYLTVALFFAGVNLLVGRSPFYTVELLGEPLVGPRPMVPGPEWRWAARLAFNGVHLVGSLLLGLAAAVLFRGVERAREARGSFLLILVVGSAGVLLGLQVLAAEAEPMLLWRSVLSAHLAGAVTTTAYFLWSRGAGSEANPAQGDPGGHGAGRR